MAFATAPIDSVGPPIGATRSRNSQRIVAGIWVVESSESCAT